MAHERETWLDHGVAELLLRGRPVETTDEHAQAQAERLARVLEEAAYVPHADSAELPGEAAALAAFRQSAGTVARTGTPGWAARPDGDDDGIGTVRLAPGRRGIRLPSATRPLRLGLAAAMAGCALSGVAAGAGFLYAPSAGESPPRPSNSVSDALTPAPLVSESPSSSLNPPPLSSDTAGGTDSDSPGASSDATTGGPGHKDKNGQGTDGWKNRHGEKWFAKLVQACHEYRDGTIAAGKKKQLEDAARGPQGVARFCDQLLSGGGHHDGAQGNSGASGGNSIGGGEGPQSSGPIEGGTPGTTGGGTDGGTDGGSSGGGTDGGTGGTDGGTGGGTDGGTGGGSEGPPSDWPGGDYEETIGMDDPPASDSASLPPQLPAMPGAGPDSSAGPEPEPDPSAS